jgi:hypothetical protein
VTLHLLELRLLSGLDPAGKARFPVSVVLLDDGTVYVVSRYGDPVWYLYPYILHDNEAPSKMTIDWRIQLTDGLRLTDPEHALLLTSAKDFIWSLFTHPVEGRKRPTMSTLIKKVGWLKPLLRWMVQEGLHQFADIANRTLDYVPVAHAKAGGSKADTSTVVNRLQVVEDLYHQRDKLNDALPQHPWPHESPCSLAGFKRGRHFHKPKTEFIPDSVAACIGETALDYVQNRSARILPPCRPLKRRLQGRLPLDVRSDNQEPA